MENKPAVIALDLSVDDYITIENLAACNYTPEQVALYLLIDKDLLLQEYFKKSSLLRQHYDRGILKAQFQVDFKLLEKAKEGSVTACQELKKLQDKRLFDNHKMRILNEN